MQRGGAYGGYGLVTILYAGALLHALYKRRRGRAIAAIASTPTRRRAARCAATARSSRHAFEALLDEMAAELGLDPFAVRRANLLAETRTARSTTCRSIPTACRPALDWVEEASGWHERRGRLPRGHAASAWPARTTSRGSAKPVHWSGEPHAVVNLKLDFDGSITVLTGASDIGQGSSTLLAQVVAEVLLRADERASASIATDSALTPKDNGSYSSRVSFMVGNAALRAAQS